MAHVLGEELNANGESDEEINTNRVVVGGCATGGSSSGCIVMGEAPESDEDDRESDGDDERFEDANDEQLYDDGSSTPPPPPSPYDENALREPLKYNTLLHRKLRERNEQLKRELIEVACQPYNSATKEIGSITQQLIKSQKMVQGISSSLRKMSKELFLLEDALDDIRTKRNIIPNLNRDMLNNAIKVTNSTNETPAQDTFPTTSAESVPETLHVNEPPSGETDSSPNSVTSSDTVIRGNKD